MWEIHWLKLKMEIKIKTSDKNQSSELLLYFSLRSDAFDSYAYTGFSMYACSQYMLLYRIFATNWQQTATHD